MEISDQEFAAIADWLAGDATKEREAKHSMGRILRDKTVSMAFRLQLATLFDPDGAPSFARPRGRPRIVDDWRIAGVVCGRIRQGDLKKKKQAYYYAAEKLDVCLRTVEGAMARYMRPFKRFESFGHYTAIMQTDLDVEILGADSRIWADRGGLVTDQMWQILLPSS
jgi:hypothetical protein